MAVHIDVYLRAINREVFARLFEAVEKDEENFCRKIREGIARVLGIPVTDVSVNALEYQIPSGSGRKIYLTLRPLFCDDESREVLDRAYEKFEELESLVEDILEEYGLKTGEDYLFVRMR